MTLRETIRKLRYAGLSFDDIAQSMNVSSRSVRRWAAGEVNPKPAVLARLAELLARTPSR